MRALITGCGGFIGSHLADFLVEKGLDVTGTVYKNNKGNIKHLQGKIKVYNCDLSDRRDVEDLIRKTKPDVVFHLAAQSMVIPSWNDPEHTIISNTLGTLYLYEAIRKSKLTPLIIVACSSAEYGPSEKDEIPIKENKEFRPVSPYAVSKVGTDMLSYMCWKVLGMRIIRVRYFNITGPRKTDDACSDFARMIAEFEKGKRQQIEVGHLESLRDIIDIGDAIEATWLILNKGKVGEVYNICSGRGYKIGDLLKKLVLLSTKDVKIKKVEHHGRMFEEPIYIGDNSKLRKLGWLPKVPIEQTLSNILEYWRNRV